MKHKMKTKKPNNKYKCGHESDGIIILDNNELSLSAYFDWSDTVGLNGTNEQCWECYNGKI